MMKRILILISALVALALLAAGYAAYYVNAPGPLAVETTVLFKHGERFQSIADDMAQANVIRLPMLFKAFAAATGDARKFKAGEYRFPAGVTPHQAMEMIAQGKVVIHKLTIAEGLTVRDVLQLVRNEPGLDGDIADGVKEGSLLPQTYYFTYGDKRQDIVARMQKDMAALLTALWQKRKTGLPLATPGDALTLASIVEKETGVNSERGRVAAVFVNRLRKGMKLQSDPTVAYGLTQQNGPLGHALTLDDLHSPTAYNTYVIDGLPPAPIANPGRAALEAVLNPPDTDELYFVATGTGGHHFAASLQEHNENVRQYRQRMH
jgi:UPF0755 protein